MPCELPNEPTGGFKQRGRRLPSWLRVRLPPGGEMIKTQRLLQSHRLSTVCAGAHCPNLPECFSRRTATFMVLGDRCTRNCRYCAVEPGSPQPVETDEPDRLAAAAAELGLLHVVITSVTRDDLPDEGAGHFARCVRAVRARLPNAWVEVLTPDFHARTSCIEQVLAAGPAIFNHNIEVVRRLTPLLRPQADYRRSLETLRIAGELRIADCGLRNEDAAIIRSPNQHPASSIQHPVLTKSGLMIGLGETTDEIVATFEDLRSVGCDILTVGQYLAPSPAHAPIKKFYEPGEFDELAARAREMGFLSVAAGPFVRSSYNAAEVYQRAIQVR